MKYLCLIYLDEAEMEVLPGQEMDALNAGHLDLNDELRRSGHFIEAEALQPYRETVRLRRGNRVTVTDGPFAEAKEIVGGFFLLDCASKEDAVAIASECPATEWATVEVREIGPCWEGNE